MTGILCMDKPAGFTSFDVVAKLRGMSKTRKVGHAGTLDPMATGVLPVFFGRATKACDILPNQDKRYTAEFQLGLVTDTQDSTGKVLARREVLADASAVEETLKHFRGEIAQVPPMYSAVQVDGRRLYDLARQGLEVQRPARQVTVYDLRLLRADERTHLYTVDVCCSKGTYVRTLCHDIGQRLGCGATLTALRRTAACGFTEEHCLTLEEVQAMCDAGTLRGNLLPVEEAFAALPRLELPAGQGQRFCNGVKLELARLGSPVPGRVSVWSDGRFLGVAEPEASAGVLRLVKLFAEGTEH